MESLTKTEYHECENNLSELTQMPLNWFCGLFRILFFLFSSNHSVNEMSLNETKHKFSCLNHKMHGIVLPEIFQSHSILAKRKKLNPVRRH